MDLTTIRQILSKGTRAQKSLSVIPQMGSYHAGNATVTATLSERVPYWQNSVPKYRDVSADTFHSWEWQTKNMIQKSNLRDFLQHALPHRLNASVDPALQHIETKEDFVNDLFKALDRVPMAVKLTPYMVSRIEWNNALDDPVRRQFLPLGGSLLPDAEQVVNDSLGETNDSLALGLIQRYPDRALFLATSHCPLYCRYCTRAYAIGPVTKMMPKTPQKPAAKRWIAAFEMLHAHPEIEDVVVSGGDAYQLPAHQLRALIESLLKIPSILRIRIASKGVGVGPMRIIDDDDAWTDALIDSVKLGRSMGKQVCLHTHINHAQEISWTTELAAQKLFANGVTVRNQAVFLHGINNSFATQHALIKALSRINIQPYYVYQCDMVRGIEDLRTPLHEIIAVDKQIRGTVTGFMVPNFVVDLPGGGGKRLVSTYESYDREKGVATFVAPGLKGGRGEKVYRYFDPLPKPQILKQGLCEELLGRH